MKVNAIGWNEFYNKLETFEQKLIDDVITLSQMLHPILLNLQTDFDNSFLQFPITNNLILQIIYENDQMTAMLRENSVS